MHAKSAEGIIDPLFGCSDQKHRNRMEEMTHSSSDARYLTGLNQTLGGNESHSSGVSWAAVIAGAFVTAALSLILLALGTGFGFSSVSLWSNVGASASTVGTSAIVWLILYANHEFVHGWLPGGSTAYEMGQYSHG